MENFAAGFKDPDEYSAFATGWLIGRDPESDQVDLSQLDHPQRHAVQRGAEWGQRARAMAHNNDCHAMARADYAVGQLSVVGFLRESMQQHLSDDEMQQAVAHMRRGAAGQSLHGDLMVHSALLLMNIQVLLEASQTSECCQDILVKLGLV